MKAVVDKERCIGCGYCCNQCPSVFQMTEDEKAEAYQETTIDNIDDTQTAMIGCPVSAISWED